MTRAGRDDAGGAAIWVLACAALVLVTGLVGTAHGLAVLARHRAETAADLAALAGAQRIGLAGSPCTAAGVVARRNGGQLSGCRLTLSADGRSGLVVVTVSMPVRLPWLPDAVASARAAAERAPAGAPSVSAASAGRRLRGVAAPAAGGARPAAAACTCGMLANRGQR